MNLHRLWVAGAAGLALIAAAIIAVFIWGSVKGDSTAPEPDRVVNVLLRCTQPAFTLSGGIMVPDDRGRLVSPQTVVPAQELSSDECQKLLDGAPSKATSKNVSRTTLASRLNALQEVTIRTSAGNAYTIEVPAMTPVAVGDVWPAVH